LGGSVDRGFGVFVAREGENAPKGFSNRIFVTVFTNSNLFGGFYDRGFHLQSQKQGFPHTHAPDDGRNLRQHVQLTPQSLFAAQALLAARLPQAARSLWGRER
jgi:hypothetical protein